MAVGDLNHDGKLSVMVSTLDGTVDVYDAAGQLEPGWTQHMNLGVTPPAIPRPKEPNVRIPVTEATTSPTLADLGGNGVLDIVEAGSDGYLHAWQPDGRPVPGWPVKVSLPSSLAVKGGYTLENDQRLVSTPTVAWLSGKNPGDGPGGADTPPDIVERSQFTQIMGPGTQPLPYSEVFAYGPGGNLLPGWPATVHGLLEYYGSAQDAITEGSSSPVAAAVTGSGSDSVIDSPVWSPPVQIDGAGQVVGSYGSLVAAGTSLLATQAVHGGSASACQSTPPPDVPISFASSGAIGKVGGALVYAQAQIGAASLGCLQFPNTGLGLNNYESAYPANAASNPTGAQVSGFPGKCQGLGFLSSPVIADVTGSRQASVIEGGDTSSITAVTSSGAEAAGFPRFTSGWDLYAPTAGDLLSNGHVDLVATTREGYLYAWATPGQATADTQWWSGRHDEWNSGNYGVDSRPPGALRGPRWAPGGSARRIGRHLHCSGGQLVRRRGGEIPGDPGAIGPPDRRGALRSAGTVQSISAPPWDDRDAGGDRRLPPGTSVRRQPSAVRRPTPAPAEVGTSRWRPMAVCSPSAMPPSTVRWAARRWQRR